VARAAALGYRAVALTDHDGLSGAMVFAQAARAAGITPITGAEVTLADGSHLTLLVESRTGYGNLCRLLTHLHHDLPIAPVPNPSDGIGADGRSGAQLGDYAEGLILLTGCRHGQLAQLVDADRFADAHHVLNQYVASFGRENVVVELQHHFVYGDTWRVKQLVRLAEAAGVRYAATGNVHYHDRNRHRLQDVLVAITHRTTLDGCHRERRPNAEFSLRSPAEMAHRWRRYPEAIATTVLIAGRCAAFDLTRDLHYTFPDHDAGTGATPDGALTRLTWDLFAQRYGADQAVARARVNKELRLIAKHRLAGFFLMYHDLLALAREVATELRGTSERSSRRFLPPGRGRGSSVSSVVCYLIGLSPVDPLAHDLYVGRFLNDELPSVPDIDLDFPREIREHLIVRVSEVFGRDRAAMVCAFSTYQLKSAVRDIGKALGLPQVDLDRIARLSEPRSAAGLGAELARIPDLAARLHTPPWSDLVTLAGQLAGFPRHITQHSGGMVISATPLNELVPIQPAAMDGRYLCQWDKDSCEDARFIKIDFLALGMLSLVEECLDLIDVTRPEPVDLSRIDFADPAVYAMIRAGDTLGVFQVESRAQIQMLRRTKPENLADLIVQVAIVRPGPIIGGAVTPFVARRENPAYTPDYDHPSLEPVLRETLGVILYQEQVIQVAETLAGFTAGQADQLRRAMTRKRSIEAMAALKGAFLTGCLANGVSVEVAERVFAKLGGFADYGFPKSHAAAFGLLAYQSCWLKCYYPAEFLCALLNNQPMGFYSPHVLVNEAKRRGLRVLRPDLNLSQARSIVTGARAVRIGLGQIKGIAAEVAQDLIGERQRGGAYHSLADLVRRAFPPPTVIEALIAAGALDGFGLQRREMLWQIGLFIAPQGFRERTTRHLVGKQLPLALPTGQDHVELPPTTAWERMADEYRTLGLSPHYHPFQLLRPALERWIATSQRLANLPHGLLVRVAGLVVCRQRPATAKGITFLSLEDELGLINVIVYPDLYERQRHTVRAAPLLGVEGRLQHANGNINVLATRLWPVETQILAPPRLTVDGGHRREEADPGSLDLGWAGEPPADELTAVIPEARTYR